MKNIDVIRGAREGQKGPRRIEVKRKDDGRDRVRDGQYGTAYGSHHGSRRGKFLNRVIARWRYEVLFQINEISKGIAGVAKALFNVRSTIMEIPTFILLQIEP